MAGRSPWTAGVPEEFTTPMRIGNRRPVGYQQITDLSSAVSLTVPDGARVALIQAETQDIRLRDDGTNPTASVGLLIKAVAAGVEPFPYAGDLTTVTLIEAAASAKANILYYG